MSSSSSFEETFDALMNWNEMLLKKVHEDSQHNQETQAQNEYLWKQFGAFLKQKQKINEELLQSEPRRQEQVFSHNLDSSSEDEPLRMARPKPQFQANTNYFKVEILEFEGKLDPEEFLDWLHSVKCVFEYKDVPKDKKAKFVA